MIEENKGEITRRLKTNLFVGIGYFFLTETFFITVWYGSKIQWLNNLSLSFPEFVSLLVSLIIAILLLKFINFLWRILKSKRTDIFSSIFVGMCLSFFLNYEKISLLVSRVNILCILIQSVVIALLVFVIQFFYTILIKKGLSKNNVKSNFLSDNVDSDSECEDELGVKRNAEKFAVQVIDNFAKDSLVFGLDAPWGSGKTTYLAFVKKFWEREYGDKVVVFNFMPQSFDTEVSLFDKFVDQLNECLKEHNYVPEISSSLYSYFKSLKDIEFSFKFLQFSAPLFKNSSDPLENLKRDLEFFDKKIIVIIDDLDRLPLGDIKTILNIVKKSFVLPNVSYILCYDTENINAFEGGLVESEFNARLAGKLQEGSKISTDIKIDGKLFGDQSIDNKKITEFFEKVVNIKISLFPDPDQLKSFMFAGLKQVNLDDGPIRSFITDSFTLIFNPENYYQYRPFIGDLRKIKRFLNTLKILGHFNIDFKIYDYHAGDLVNLMLIYINYPNIFRKIYDTETNGGKGFFSVVSPYEYVSGKDDKRFYNSEKYFEYLSTLSQNERYLVEKIFTVEKRLKDCSFNAVDPQSLKTLACFNGCIGAGRNLDEYLMLITTGKLPPKINNYNYYLGKIEKLKEKLTLKGVLDMDEDKNFDLSKGEISHQSLFTAVSESLEKEIDFENIQKIIDYLLEYIPIYSSLENKNFSLVGLRDNLSYNLVSLLNRGGWKDQHGKFFFNTPENVKTIADRIFGEGDYVSSGGVLKTLSDSARGILGFYDLMLFRLFCSHDRQGAFYNLFIALGKHADENASSSGIITDLAIGEMREISQFCFFVFNERYIKTKLNFIIEGQKISEDELFGKTLPIFLGASEEEKEVLRQGLERIKNKVISYVLYQLSNSMVSQGVGCGYYDVAGTDNKAGIHNAMNDYLFGVCFNLSDPEKAKQNAESFIDYMMIHLSHGHHREEDEKFFLESSLKEVFDIKRLREYWDKNREDIKKYVIGVNKIIYTLNSDLSYSDYLEPLYKELDNLI